MDELGKIKRVIERHGTVDEVLLVLDATTGQNGLRQARVFAEVVDITGIILTKLDGTAKGGIVISRCSESSACRSSWSGSARARTTWRSSIPKCSWTRYWRGSAAARPAAATRDNHVPG